MKIEISKELSERLHREANKVSKPFNDYIYDKYHYDKTIPVFHREKDNLYLRIPPGKKVPISEGEFQLFEALNERVITIRYASEKRKTHERI